MTTDTPQSTEFPRLRISEIPSRDCVRGFVCGVFDIDKWVRDRFHRLHSKNRSMVFCAFAEGGNSALGFYALSLRRINSELLFDQDGDFYKNDPAPLAYIDFIAVNRAIQGKRIGQVPMIDAVRRVYAVAKHLPVYGLALRSLNDRTRAYYKKFGFRCREEDKSLPVMILPIWTILDLVEGRPSTKT